ncbi:MAG: two-component regulator propeller domain-containing protein [Bacteroidota bacterium]
MKTIINRLIILVLILSGSAVKSQVFTNYTTVEGLPDNFIIGGVAVDTNNNKWFGTAVGVAKFDDVNWTVYDTADGLVDNYTSCIAVDKNNNVWVGTNFGVSKFDGSAWTTYTTADGLIDNGVIYIAADIDGSVWFATTAGVSKYDGVTWTDFTTTDGLPSNNIDYIAVDAAGNKWFGTVMGGVSMYDNSTFTNISMATMDSLQDDNVFAVGIDNSGHKFIGTWYGISELDNANNWFANYDTASGLYNNYVRDIKVDSNDNVWVGLFADYNTQGGISKFDGSTWTSYTMADGLVDKQVIRLAVDKNNVVWIATGNGVSKLQDFSGITESNTDNTFRIFPNPATDLLKVDISGLPQEVTNIEIYNATQKVREYSLNSNFGSISIPVNELNAGMYFLRLGNSVEKFIITR